MWDEAAGLYCDVDPRTMARTGVKAGVGFYPLLTDLVPDDHFRRLLQHLTDPETFGTPYPLPSSSADDPLFSPWAEWKGKRHVCPWNGRVWPMVNSHVIEGLLRQWHRGREAAGPVAGRLLHTFVRMMHHDGDPGRPNCYEHYNPLTGHPSRYRGIDDYQHSWVFDLIMRGAVGLEPTADGVTVHPLPMGLDDIDVRNVTLRGRRITLARQAGRTRLTVDDAKHEWAGEDVIQFEL